MLSLKKYVFTPLFVGGMVLISVSGWTADSDVKTEAAATTESATELTSTPSSDVPVSTTENVDETKKAEDAPQVRTPAPEGAVEEFWKTQEWANMSDAEQALWKKLGWSNINWKSDVQPPSESKVWDELTDEERNAAGQLGYTKEIWNQDLVRHPSGNAENFWSHFDWNQLTPAEQALWGKLGWSQESWGGKTNVPIPDSENKKWQELSTEERDVAQQLGYDEKSWDMD